MNFSKYTFDERIDLTLSPKLAACELHVWDIHDEKDLKEYHFLTSNFAFSISGLVVQLYTTKGDLSH